VTMSPGSNAVSPFAALASAGSLTGGGGSAGKPPLPPSGSMRRTSAQESTPLLGDRRGEQQVSLLCTTFCYTLLALVVPSVMTYSARAMAVQKGLFGTHTKID
jgi:hypothetical protein